MRKPTLDPNKDFLIRFTANKRHFLGKYFRTLIKARNLHKLIGESNATVAITAAYAQGEDKFTIKFRKHGRVEFYAV